MNRFISLLAVLAWVLTSSAQFVITKDGFVDKDDNTKKFVVIQFDGMTADSICKVVEGNLQRNMMNAEDKITKDGNTLIVTGHRNNYIAGKAMGVVFGGAYHIVFKFTIEAKDGRARVLPTEILLSTFADKNKYPDFSTYNWQSIVTFKKDGTLKNKTTGESLQNFVNGFVRCMTYQKKDEEW